MSLKKYLKMEEDNKIRITLTEKELGYLEHILWHFTDYMSHDDRPDHGLGILKGYREMTNEQKEPVLILAGKLRRRHREIQAKRWTKET